MTTRLRHHDVHALLTSLATSKVVNLDVSVRTLLDPIAETLSRSGAGGEAGFHVLCCNEYFLVTGLTALEGIDEVRQVAASVRSALGPTRGY